MRKISWLQISDLHVLAEVDTKIMLSDYETLAKAIHPQFLIVSGDFRHKLKQPDFKLSLDYLNKVIEIFKIKKTNVFLVPGNHDVNDYDQRSKVIASISEELNKEVANYNHFSNYMVQGDNSLINAFDEYTNFVTAFYEGSGVCDERVRMPAQVFCSDWNRAINIIHINSSLISDGARDHKEIIDINELARCPIRYPEKPIIAVGHHHFDDIDPAIAIRLNRILKDRNVQAYLSGDIHVLRESRIEEEEPYTHIPCISCPKASPESGDSYSDIGLIYYTWDTSLEKVYMDAYGWNPKKGFMLSPFFQYEVNKKKFFYLKKKKSSRSPKVLLADSDKHIKDEFDLYKYVDPFGLKMFQNQRAVPLGRALLMQMAKYQGKGLKSVGQTIFNDYVDSIVNSEKSCPLTIYGIPGSGKSTLLTLLYLSYLQTNKGWSFLIDLHYYDKLSKRDADADIDKTISFIDDSIKRNEKVVLFVDGLNQYKRHYISIEEKIRKQLIKWKEKKGVQMICSFGTQDSTQYPPYKKYSSTFRVSGERNVVLSPTDVNTKRFSHLVNTLLECNGINLNSRDRDRLKNKCKIIDEGRSTLRTVLFLINEYIARKEELFLLPIGELFLEYYKGQYNSNDKKLKNVASTVSDFYLGKRDCTSLDVNVLKDPSHMDFLFAYNYITLCLDSKKREKIKEYDCIFTARINRFVVQLAQLDPKIEENFINNLILCFEDTSFPQRTKIQIAYFLGRANKSENAQRDAKDYLLQLFNNKLKEYKHSKKSKEEVMLLRSIGISLLYLGCTEHENDFYSFIIFDEAMNRINRDFHVAYYTENSYKIPNTTLFDKDVIYSFRNVNRVYMFLFHSVEKKLDSKTHAVNIITIISLVLYWRYGAQTGIGIPKEQFKGFEKVLDNSSNYPGLPDVIKNYIDSAKNNISKQNVYTASLAKLYSFKTIKRTGWINRKISNHINVESDADHTWACCMLANILLPDNIYDCELIDKNEYAKYEDFDKNKIIQLLLVHDLPECITGDIPSPKKKDIDEEDERIAIEKIGALGAFPFLSPLFNIAKDCGEFATRDDANASINVQIASDIDRLEPLIQLFFYREYLEKPFAYSEVQEWIKNPRFRIHTSFGVELLKLLMKHILNEKSFTTGNDVEGKNE